MVTNLPKEAKAQWQRVVNAKNKEEKLRELEKFYSLIPKHKGTKNLLKHIRSQMARLREEIEAAKRRKTSSVVVSPWFKPKHGVARVAMVSSQYSLYSLLAERLNNKNLLNLTWAFEPYYTVLNGEDYQFQLAILPLIGVSESIDNRVINFLDTCDYILVLGTNEKSLRDTVAHLYHLGIIITDKKIEFKIKKMPSGGLRIIGWGSDPKKHDDLKKMLNEYGFKHAIIEIPYELTLEEIENILLGIAKYIKGRGLIITSSGPFLSYRIRGLKIQFDNEVLYENLASLILNELNLIRVYPSEDLRRKGSPVVLKKGSTIHDLLLVLHERFNEYFNYALVNREGKIIKVSRNYPLEDGDIINIRMR